MIPGNFQAWFNLNSSSGGSSSAGYWLGLWGWQEKTLRLPPPLLSPSPHLPAGRAWSALGQRTPLTHTQVGNGATGWVQERRKGRKGGRENTSYTGGMTRKCEFGVMNSEQEHKKLWNFIKQRMGTVYQQHMGWDEGMKYRSEYVWVPAHRKE